MRKQGSQQRSWMAAKKEEKKGQPSMRKDGYKKRKKKGSKKDKKWLKKCPKGLKIGVKEGSQLREKLAAKF